MTLRALLVDGGATLFPETEEQLESWAQALAGILPGQYERVAAALAESAERSIAAGRQHSDADTAAVLDSCLPGTGDRATEVRHALAHSRGTQPRQAFPGAAELLAGARSLGLVTILVSNTSWHSEDDYRARLAELGLASLVDGIVSSFDVGARKPDRRMFAEALARARCPAVDCVMAGDSEDNDIVPAHALGMRTIRVTVQHPLGAGTVASAVAATPAEALRFLGDWCR